MTAATGSIEPVRDGIYTTGYRARCSCGWVGNAHERPSQTLAELHAHDHFMTGDDV